MTVKKTITVDNDIWNSYKNMLESKGYKLSTRIRILIEKDYELIKNGSI